MSGFHKLMSSTPTRKSGANRAPGSSRGGSGYMVTQQKQADADTIDHTTSNVDDALCAEIGKEMER